MGTVHELSKIRPRLPLPTLPTWAITTLQEFGVFNIGPIVGFELWGRGRRSAVMMVDGRGAALNASLSPSHPREGFPDRQAARSWAVAYFAGLGRDLPEIRPTRTPQVERASSRDEPLPTQQEGS